jgi:tRNA-Thr(GGU) m(6)t(6)A37 methyltransferase TsaA
MQNSSITYKPIGIVHSPFNESVGTPIQPTGANDVLGEIEVFPEFAKGLVDIEGFSHIIVLTHLHLIESASLIVKPFMDDKEHGVFSTRSPARPNPIGFSILKLVSVKGNKLVIQNVDIVNGTPVLDIKPFVPQFDSGSNVRIGWLEKNVHKSSVTKDDGRFLK